MQRGYKKLRIVTDVTDNLSDATFGKTGHPHERVGISNFIYLYCLFKSVNIKQLNELIYILLFVQQLCLKLVDF
jgi:hypothetical protein